MRELIIPKVKDFNVTGDGKTDVWKKTEWQELSRVGNGNSAYKTKAKALYSDTGIYILTDAEDKKLTTTDIPDQGNLFTEDVIEFFIWPDENIPIYLEYEISPMNKDLVILVPNVDGTFYGWSPWHYEDERQTIKNTSVYGGKKSSMAEVDGWMTEFYIPFTLLTPLKNSTPKPGTTWRANIYRIDYDESPCSQWAWDEKTNGNFHDYKNFGKFIFGD